MKHDSSLVEREVCPILKSLRIAEVVNMLLRELRPSFWIRPLIRLKQVKSNFNMRANGNDTLAQ